MNQTMEKYHLPYHQTGFFNRLILDYLAGETRLQEFYGEQPTPEAFGKQIRAKQAAKVDRETLVSVLKDQYAALPPSENVSANIEALGHPATFTVTTAHQPNLFTGPLYFIYKIISTINLAETLNRQYGDHHIVPVYFMGAEDHDFEELNHFHLFGQKYTWENGLSGAVGEMSTAGLEEIIAGLEPVFGEGEHARKLLDKLRAAYLARPTVAAATQYFVHDLFKEYGLVILQPGDKRFKQLFTPVIRSEVTEKNSEKLVTGTIKQLEGDYKIQVKPRAINLFYLQANSRERIVDTNGDFEVLKTGVRFTQETLAEEISAHPERFSPNVILRGLFQETILPNLAYIGGGGELSYWLEMKSLFDHNEVVFPLLLLRNSVLWIDRNTHKKLKKLGMTFADLFQPVEQLINSYVAGQTERSIDLTREKASIQQIFQSVREKGIAIDAGLGQMIGAEEQKLLNQFDNLEKKLLRAEKQQFESAINQIRKVREKLFPGQQLQERHDNFGQYYLQYGEDFIAVLKENLDPLDPRLTILAEA